VKVLKFGGKHEGGESADWGITAHCTDFFGNGLGVRNNRKYLVSTFKYDTCVNFQIK